ncbi:MAG: UbiX family flavin prenyltransferase [Firmicutes bacterium]|nr:UbiX family flavin prenyltransferase [Bacillota bacterium]
MRIIVGLSGATGAIYGITLLKTLRDLEIETHLVLTPWAEATIKAETDYSPEEVMSLGTHTHAHDDLAAPIASGTCPTDAMVIAPCSMKTLAAIASGYSDNLLTRAADVMIKERRPLVLVARETPLSPIHLENMLKLAQAGAVILPPVPSFYQRPSTVEDIVKGTVAKILDQLRIKHNLVPPWGQETKKGIMRRS